MFIGKWNKSVILTYIGLIISILGICLSFTIDNSVRIVMSCLIIAGICDLFDGFIARKCKRTEEEKNFGIQLDSLVDVVDFVALPICIFISIKLNAWYNIIGFMMFAICAVARLAYFNTIVGENDKPVKYYNGLPVTFSALIFPLFYLLRYILTINIFITFYSILIFVVAILNIMNIKIKKPKGLAYLLFSILAIILLVLYLGVL